MSDQEAGMQEQRMEGQEQRGGQEQTQEQRQPEQQPQHQPQKQEQEPDDECKFCQRPGGPLEWKGMATFNGERQYMHLVLPNRFEYKEVEPNAVGIKGIECKLDGTPLSDELRELSSRLFNAEVEGEEITVSDEEMKRFERLMAPDGKLPECG